MTTEQLQHRFANSSISRLDVQINDLLNRRRALCNYRQMLVTLLSPVRRLPYELLGEIFRYCLPQNYNMEGAHKAVMLPSHVCKHWRDVALSIPALWTNIVLHVTNETFEPRKALVTAWFSRSGGLPLSFTLTGGENVLPILDFLLQYCGRWQYVNLSIPVETLQCLEAAKGHLQRLETIQINSGYRRTVYSIEHVLESAPNLWKVSLSGQKFIWSGLSGSWAQLTELYVGYPLYTVGGCLALLQSARNLQKLSILVGKGDVEGHHHFVFSHPLVSLHVWESGDYGIFNHITLPNLRDLIVDEIYSDWPQSQFISFLARSSSSLQSFSLVVPMERGDSDMWDDNMIQILQHTPSLHSLCLRYDFCEWIEGSLWKRLSPRVSDNGQVDCLLPKLNTISIQVDCQLTNLDYTALADMILSRCSLARNSNTIPTPIERIQKVEVKCFYDESLDAVDDTMWHKEVSEQLSPLQEVVDTVDVVIL